MTKIMFLNPIATEAEDDALFARMAREHKLPGTEVHVTSLPETIGRFDHIEFRSYEGIVTSGIIRAARAASLEGFDAFAIGCFYDTGLSEAREVSGDMIVTAPCVASCEIAASLSNRFGVIVGRRKWVDQMQATVHACGHRDRLAGFYHVELRVTEFQEDRARTEAALAAAARRAVAEDFAECVILGCTMEIGFYQDLSKQVGVPVIDPSIAALKRAEYAAHLKRACGWVPSRKWSCEAPPEHEMLEIGAFGTEGAFGRRTVVPAE